MRVRDPKGLSRLEHVPVVRDVGLRLRGREELVAPTADGGVFVGQVGDLAVALVERHDAALGVLDVEADVRQRVHHLLDGRQIFAGFGEEGFLELDFVALGHGCTGMFKKCLREIIHNRRVILQDGTGVVVR